MNDRDDLDHKPASDFRRIGHWIEDALKISAVLVAFGYMSFRSHLNYLGISNTSPLPSDRYIMEAYHWLLVTIMPLAGPIPLIGLLVLAGAYVRRRFFSHSAQSGPKTASWWRNETASLALVLILTVTLIALRLRFGGAAVAEDVAIGPLRTERLPEPQRLQIDSSIYVGLCAICAGGYAFLRVTRLQGHAIAHRRHHVIRYLSYFALASIAIQLPLIFGRVLDSNKFHEITIRRDSEKDFVSGLLVLETSESFVLWRAVTGNGQIVVVPRDDLLQVEIGPSVDLLDRARTIALQNPTP